MIGRKIEIPKEVGKKVEQIGAEEPPGGQVQEPSQQAEYKRMDGADQIPVQHGKHQGGHQDGQLWVIADQAAAEIPAEGHLLPQDGEQKEPGVSGYRLRDRLPEGLSGEGIEPGDLQEKMDQEVNAEPYQQPAGERPL